MKTSSLFAFLYSPSRRELRKRIWQLTVPVILANITIPLVGLVDTAAWGISTAPIISVQLPLALFSTVWFRSHSVSQNGDNRAGGAGHGR